MRLILLNGPPDCGQEAAGTALAAALPNAVVMRFADPLRAATHIAFGIPADTDTSEYADTMRPEFANITPNAAYGSMRDQAVKQTFGRNHFGLVLARALAVSVADYVIVTDAVLDYEVAPAVAQATAENTLLVRVYKPGVDNPRAYLQVPGVASLNTSNADTDDAFADYVVPAVKTALGLPL